MTKIINLNKHDIIIVVGGERHVFPPSGSIANVATKDVEADCAGGFPCVVVEYGEITGLPEPKANTYYIVNMLVLERAPANRTDLLAPDTGPSAIRENGQVKAVTRFKRKLSNPTKRLSLKDSFLVGMYNAIV